MELLPLWAGDNPKTPCGSMPHHLLQKTAVLRVCSLVSQKWMEQSAPSVVTVCHRMVTTFFCATKKAHNSSKKAHGVGVFIVPVYPLVI